MFRDNFNERFILPEFNSAKYNEIDEFKDYEYTNNVGYEFAIRNKKVLKKLHLFEKCILEYEKKYSDLSNLIDEIDMNNFSFLEESGFDLAAMIYWLFRKRASQIDELSKLKSDELCEHCKLVSIRKEEHQLYGIMQPVLRLYIPEFRSGKILEGLSCSYAKIKNDPKIRKINKALNGRLLYLDDMDNFNDTEWSSEIHPEEIENEILPSVRYSFKRPLLRLKHKHSLFNVQVDLNMDSEHFIDYMKNLKSEYDQRKTLDQAFNEKDFEKAYNEESLKQRKERIKKTIQMRQDELKTLQLEYEKTDSSQKNRLNALKELIDKLQKELNKPISQWRRDDKNKYRALAKLQFYKWNKKNKKNVKTFPELFGEEYIRPSKPNSIDGTGPERIKELLYVHDCLQEAQIFNEKVDQMYNEYCEFNQEITSSEKKENLKFIQEVKTSEKYVLNLIYIALENQEPVINHKYFKRRRAQMELIDDFGYKYFL